MSLVTRVYFSQHQRTGTESYSDPFTSWVIDKNYDPVLLGTPALAWYQDSVRTPNYHLFKGPKKKRRRALPDNPYYSERLSFESGSFQNHSVWRDWASWRPAWDYFSHTWNTPFWAADPFTPRQIWDPRGTPTYHLARNKAVARLLAKINNMHINLGQAYAERRQTASLIADNAARVAQMALALRRGDFRGVVNASGLKESGNYRTPREMQRIVDRAKKVPPDKRLANHWLELQFGWKPLLDDVYGGAELLAAHAVGDIWREYARSSGTVRGQFTSRESHPGLVERYNYMCRIRFAAEYRLDDRSLALLSQTGLNNPALLVWELLPYSFVVDWFINVSGYLRSIYQADGFQLLRGTESNEVESINFRLYGGGSAAAPSNNWTTDTRNGTMTVTQRSYQRSPISAIPSQMLFFRNPLDNGPAWKFATSLALLRQLFK